MIEDIQKVIDKIRLYINLEIQLRISRFFLIEITYLREDNK